MKCNDCIYFKRCVVLGVELDIHHDEEADKNCRHFKNKTDFKEIVRGKWLITTAFEIIGCKKRVWGKNPIVMLYCSNCRKEPYSDKEFFDDETLKNLMTAYCPRCGAKMDKE